MYYKIPYSLNKVHPLSDKNEDKSEIIFSLQKEFAENIIKCNQNSEDLFLQFISSNVAQERFAIYRYNIFCALKEVIFEIFKNSCIAIGEELALKIIATFIKGDTFHDKKNNLPHLNKITSSRHCSLLQNKNFINHSNNCIEKNTNHYKDHNETANNSSNLPKSACLDYWGGKFPSFLQKMDNLNKAFPYIGEYAHYEWIQHLCYIGANTLTSNLNLNSQPKKDKQTKINIESLADLQKIKISFCTNIYFFKSKYNFYDLDEIIANQKPIASFQFTQKNTTKKYYCLITKVKYQTMKIWLNEVDWFFILNLRKYSKKYQYNSLVHCIKFALENTQNILHNNATKLQDQLNRPIPKQSLQYNYQKILHLLLEKNIISLTL